MINGCAAAWWGILLLAPLWAQPAAQQAAEKCVFAGVVQDSVSGQRLPRAQVSLHSTTPGKGIYGTTTDASGAFHFEGVEVGDYHVRVSASEHAFSELVSLKPGQAVAVLHFMAGESISGAVAALDPIAAVTGHVTDGDGEPIEGAQVELLTERWFRGTRRYESRDGTTTDDRGAYRLEALPGRYFVAAGLRESGAVPAVFSEGPGKAEMRVASVVYPNSPGVEGATALEVRAGQQYGGIDVRLPTVAVYHVRGAVRPWGAWTGPRSLTLTRRDGGIFDDSPALGKDGSFDQSGVAPGSYWLRALDMSLVGIQAPVEVTDRDVEGVVFTAVPPVDLKGQVRFEDDGPHDLSKVLLVVTRLDSSHPLGRQETGIRADGTFAFHRLAAAQTALELAPPGDYYLQSATFHQREVEDGLLDLTSGAAGELEIVLGSGTGTVSGTLHAGDAASGTAVAVLAPASGATGNTGVRSATFDQSGHFQFQFVPPGRYYVWALAHYDPDHWQNMDFAIQMQASGVAVEVVKNGSAQVEIPAVVE